MKQTLGPVPTARPHGGFTLIELMVTIAIVAILGLLAAPSLQGITAKVRLSGLGNQFTGHLLRARTEATTRNVYTVMCLSTTTDTAIASDDSGLTAGPACANSGTNWNAGWIVFLKPDCGDSCGDRPERAEDYIAIQAPVAADYRLDAQTASPAGARYTFLPTGRLLGSLATSQFDLNYQTASSPYTQQFGYDICVDPLGRTRTIGWNGNC